MRDKTPKNSARTMIAVLLMLVATPFASFASANNTYGNFEDYCDFEFNDGQGSTYTPDDIITYSSELTIVEVEPGMYQIEFDCTSGVTSGDLEVAVEGRSQDGVTTNDPVTVVPVSTTTINMASTTVPVSIDATGSVGSVIRVSIDIDAYDTNNQHVTASSDLVIIPMIDTTNDTTPRVSFWYGKVNQHNENGTWMTDPDGVSGGGTYADWGDEGWADRKVEYCQKFWPNTVSVEKRTFREHITFYTRGNSQAFDSYKYAYECIQDDSNNTFDNDTDDNSTLSCALSLQVSPTQVYAGDTITLTWTMTGDISSQTYISMHSGWGSQYYHSSIESNTGTFDITLPNTLDASLDYHAYVESAENGQRTTICWKYAAFDVMESGNNTGGNNTGGNNTGDNGTGDNGTGGNGTGDNGTGSGNGTGCYTCASLSYTLISADHYTMSHKITIKAIDLTPGESYTIDVSLVDEDTQTVVMTDTDSWVAANGIWYFVINNLDLDAGDYCANADLYENGVWIDDRQGCITVVNASAQLSYTLISADHYTMSHKITTKAIDLTPGESYTIDVSLVDEDTQTVVMTDTDSWVAANGIWYFVINNLNLAAGEYCANAELYENGVWIDDRQGCIIIVCEDEETNNTSSNETGTEEDEEDSALIEDTEENNQTSTTNSSEDSTEQGIGEEPEVEESSIIENVVEAIFDAIAEMIAEMFSETEKEEETDSESEELVEEAPVEE